MQQEGKGTYLIFNAQLTMEVVSGWKEEENKIGGNCFVTIWDTECHGNKNKMFKLQDILFSVYCQIVLK